MEYLKKALTYDEQADLLIGRGMVGCRSDIIEHLSKVSYYRLSGYWHSFLSNDGVTFLPNTTFDSVWRRYTFDRRLRFLVLDAIERIEVFVRSGLANGLSCEDSERSPFGYIAKRELMSNANAVDYSKLVGKFYKDHIANDRNEFISHFDRVYGDAHGALPIWMAVEVMTFGTVEDLYRAAKSTVQQSMAKALGVRDVVLMSWLKTLRSVRNLVAHHGRLWNRVIRMKPLIPAKGDLWRNPVRVGNDRVFCVLCICRFLLRTIAPQSKWQERLEDLFAEYPDIALADLGFPSQWKTSPLWQ